MTGRQTPKEAPPRKRLKREDRRELLLDLAAEIVAGRGADALTLQTLAEAAGLTKPVIYSQFGTREGLLLALYQRYDHRFFADLKAGMSASSATGDAADIFAESYLNCVTRHGQVYEAAIAALRSYAEHRSIGTQIRTAFCDTISRIIAETCSNVHTVSQPRLIALFGAIEEIGRAQIDRQISEAEARQEIRALFRDLMRDTATA